MRVERFVDTTCRSRPPCRRGRTTAPRSAVWRTGFARAHCLSGQVLREYLAVSTRTIAVNGLGLTPSQALANVHQFGTRATLLPEDASVHARLLELLTEVGAASPQVHDANIVATMPAHGVRELVTLNPCDFERYVPRIGLQAP